MIEHQEHEFPPFYEEDSKILILGSFPSKQSREVGFYYMHPQNRFWKVLARVFECELPETLSDKKEFLRKNHIALWDVIESCDIKNSSDASIRNVEPTKIVELMKKTEIDTIVTTGKKAHELYQKYSKDIVGIEDITLPSTSSANIANYSEDDLVKCYQRLKEFL